MKASVTKLKYKDIIKRGYVFAEEYTIMYESKKKSKLNISDGDSSEGIWYYPLEKDDETDKKFHFVFLNNPLMFMGMPRTTAGMVGIATSRGQSVRAIARGKECWDLFVKSGKASIDYYLSTKS